MQFVPLAFSILLCAPVLSLAAANPGNSGVPAGWSALDYDNYGNDLLNKHKYAESRKYFDAAIRIEPSRWTAYYNRAVSFRMEKNWKAAINDLNETVRLQPAFFEATWDRGACYQAIGDYASALRDFKSLEKVTYQTVNPYEMALALNEQAWIRATCPNASFRDAKVAMEEARKACTLINWSRAKHIDTLAAACAEAGDFDAAVRYEQQAINLNQSGKDHSVEKDGDTDHDKLVPDMIKSAHQALPSYLKRLELYKQHRPYRDAL